MRALSVMAGETGGDVLYDGWAAKVAARFQRRFDEIEVHHNFEYGPEFEIAICEVLRTMLPQRASVCRGYVVGQTPGQKAGDDIIIVDSAKFPTLRGLGESLAQREAVPAEAVLAYIEAKLTLDLDAEVGDGSVRKACAQAAAVKGIEREPVDFAKHLRVQFPPGVSPPRSPENYPERLNPWYTAVWAETSGGRTRRRSSTGRCCTQSVASSAA